MALTRHDDSDALLLFIRRRMNSLRQAQGPAQHAPPGNIDKRVTMRIPGLPAVLEEEQGMHGQHSLQRQRSGTRGVLGSGGHLREAASLGSTLPLSERFGHASMPDGALWPTLSVEHAAESAGADRRSADQDRQSAGRNFVLSAIRNATTAMRTASAADGASAGGSIDLGARSSDTGHHGAMHDAAGDEVAQGRETSGHEAAAGLQRPSAGMNKLLAEHGSRSRRQQLAMEHLTGRLEDPQVAQVLSELQHGVSCTFRDLQAAVDAEAHRGLGLV